MAHKLTTSLSLDTVEDADIITWLGRQENKSRAIRDAVRKSINGGITLGDIFQSLEELKQHVRRGGVSISDIPAPSFSDEPQAAASALDALARQG